MRFLVIVAFVLLSELTYGAGGAGVHDIPWKVITAQVVNVTLAVGVLIYLLKDKVRELFSGRVEKFDEEFKKAQAIKENAKLKRNEIKNRLQELKINAEKSIQDSEVQAKNNTKKLLSDSNKDAMRLAEINL
mgnify:CR=1 FL=1